MPEVQEILEELKSDAVFDSTGRFTLDRAKAREKMKKYQLIDPHYYVLEIVQAAVASGASYIDFYIDADDCIIAFDGEPFTREDLNNLYSSLFVSQKDLSLERFRELAIGINSAQALNPRYIKITSGDGNSANQMLITSPTDDKISGTEELICGTKIHVKDRISLRTAGRLLTKYVYAKLPTEGEVIKEKSIYCPVPIKINDAQINFPDQIVIPDTYCTIKFEKNGISGYMGIPQIPYELSHLHFIKWGVHIATKHLRLSFIPMVGVIYANNLTKNVSQSDIVENEIYRTVLETLKSCLDDLISDMAVKFNEIDKKDFQKRLRTMNFLLDFAESRFRASNYGESSPEVLKKIANLELFETVDRKMVSLDALVRQFNEIKYLPFSRKYFDAPHPEDLIVVYAQNEKQVNLIGKMFSSKIRNVESDFAKVYQRDKNIADWKSRQNDNIFLSSRADIRHSFSSNGITAEIGIAPEHINAYASLKLAKQNGIVCEKALDTGGLTFNVVINNDKFNPNFMWDDIRIDDEFKKAIIETLLHIPPLYLELAKSYEKITDRSAKNFEPARIGILRYMNFALQNYDAQMGKYKDTVRNLRVYDKEIFSAASKQTVKSDSLEITGVVPELTDVFINARVFKTLTSGESAQDNDEGKLVSLAELEADIKKFGICYVKSKIQPSRSRNHFIVLVTDKEEDILKRYFESSKVTNFEKNLISEQAEKRYMLRSVEEPVLTQATIAKVNINEAGMKGELGLLENEDSGTYNSFQTSGVYASFSTIPVKIFKQSRYIVSKTIRTNVSGLSAAVNFDNISVDINWSAIVEDKTWERLSEAVLSSVGELAVKVGQKLPELLPSARVRGKRLIMQYLTQNLPSNYAEPNVKIDNPIMAELADVNIFEDLTGKPLSINKIKKSYIEYGKIAIINKQVSQDEPFEKTICIASVSDVEFFKQIFGKNSIEDFEPQLRSKRLGKVIKSTRSEEKAEVPAGRTICSVRIDKDGITGEVGIPKSIYAPANTMSNARFLKEHRLVGSRALSTGMQVEAVVNYDQIKTNENWTAVIEDEAFEKVRQAIKCSIDDLAKRMLEKYNSFTPEERTEINAHIISYLTSEFTRFADIKKENPAGIAGQFAAMPIFRTAGGEKLSYIDIIDFYEKNKMIYYVPVMPDHEQMDKNIKVLAINSKMLQLLKRHFLYVKDYSEELALEKIALDNMKKPRLNSLQVEKKYIAKIVVNSGNLTGELALPDHFPVRGTITFAKNMIPVVEKLIYSRSNVFGVLNCDEFQTDKTFTDVLPSIEQKSVIIEAINNLYKQLADNYHKYENTLALEIPRRLLLDFYYEQKNRLAGDYQIMSKELENKVSGLSLLPIPKGRYISIDTFFSEISRLGYISYINKGENYELFTEDVELELDAYSFDYDICRKLAGIDRLKHHTEALKEKQIQEKIKTLRLQKKDEIQVKSERDNSTKSGSARPANEKIKKPEQKNIQAPLNVSQEIKQEAEELITPDLPTEKKLLYSIKKEFRIIRERGDYKLSEKILRNMRVDVLESDSAIVFDKDLEILTINLGAPLIKTVMDCFCESPSIIYYLLSIIYSTINRQLIKITDEDEMKFQMIMLDNLLCQVCPEETTEPGSK